MNALPNHLWADSMWGIGHSELTAEEKAILTADYSKADRNEGAELGYVQMQGRDAWPARRCSPEMACWVPEDDHKDALSPAEAVLLCAIYSVSVVFVVWLVLTLTAAWSN